MRKAPNMNTVSLPCLCRTAKTSELVTVIQEVVQEVDHFGRVSTFRR